jgi:antitoxin MazE
MEARIAKWGNSLGLRIPLAIAKATGINENSTVDLSVKNNEIVIVRTKTYRLDKLLAQISTKNKHQEVETGRALGEEIW